MDKKKDWTFNDRNSEQFNVCFTVTLSGKSTVYTYIFGYREATILLSAGVRVLDKRIGH